MKMNVIILSDVVNRVHNLSNTGTYMKFCHTGFLVVSHLGCSFMLELYIDLLYCMFSLCCLPLYYWLTAQMQRYEYIDGPPVTLDFIAFSE